MALRLLWIAVVFNVSSQSHIEDAIETIKSSIISSITNYRETGFESGITDEDVVSALQRAEEELGQSHMISYKHFDTDEPVNVYGSIMSPKTPAVSISLKSKILLKATKILQEQFGPSILKDLATMNINKFMEFDRNECLENEKSCNSNYPYRSVSGFCNNIQNPEQGMAFQPLIHLLPPDHQEFDSPRYLSVLGHPLPSPRVVSNRIHHDVNNQNKEFSLILMQFGQFLDHEITHSPVERSPTGGNLNCSSCDSAETVSSSCNPIHIPEGDPFFESSPTKCLPFVRSLPGQRTFGHRNQMNQITSYIDGSVIYGSTKCESDSIREFTDGKLKRTAGGAHLGTLLPFAQSQTDCRSAPESPCFMAGDDRNSQQPMLQSLHILFLRYHNKLAERLRRLNRNWNDEKLFQETRRIVSAILQNIVYRDFLPKIVGDMEMMKHNLSPQHDGYFDGYDERCDASISQSFATAAFRFGHSLVKRFIPRLDVNFKNFTEPMDLAQNFNNMENVYDEANGGVDSILAGLLASSPMAFDRHVSDAVRGQQKSGFDLISINIQRARDHNVPSYNKHREFCGLAKASSFSSLMSEMQPHAIDALKSIYDDVNDVDLFSGLTSENSLLEGLVGPTTACLLAEQFQRLKQCDRFYFENVSAGFRIEQLNEIRKIGLSQMICSITRFSFVQLDVFKLPDRMFNDFILCNSIEDINLEPWSQ